MFGICLEYVHECLFYVVYSANLRKKYPNLQKKYVNLHKNVFIAILS
ncbi:hypothetical protein HMPREF6485_0309 [Segatella buccae ATCC 33574]|uniref:Uncharacterized protein n=1 Tax=Segatella buccae ATCC 33574 TaxID=873513 RepID=E6K3X3_9BACT|nr:hypothetical protein HMPREF6485_0309 [Segatella buccae ATCC 33574]